MKSQHSKTVFRIVLGWVEHILENFEVQSYFEKKSDFLDFFWAISNFFKKWYFSCEKWVLYQFSFETTEVHFYYFLMILGANESWDSVL